jgi:aminopeptidase N
MRGAALALTIGLVANGAHAAPGEAAPSGPGLEPGVSRELAAWRSGRYRDVRYALRIDIAPGADRLHGTARIEVVLPRQVPDLVLDWRPAPRAARVWELRANGKPAKAKLEQEHLVVPRRLLRAGRNRIELRFESPIAVSGSAVTRYVDREDGSEYVYTLLVPSDASTVFPCFDQPDIKARFSLELALPKDWAAVANAPATVDGTHGATRVMRFAETRPISTYLFAFAAGPFAELKEAGGSSRLFVRKSRRARAGEEAPEVLRLAREGVRWFERYFESRFPFPKYDLVLIPEFAYGGMEHAGASFLREESVLFPSVPNENDLLRRAQLVFHETSHQWFGDLVTMRWFDDLWLKEGFANFMAAKAAEALLPQLPVWSAFHALKVSAYRTDVTQGTTPIYRPLANLSAAKSAYGSIVYGKAPAVLRQAEFYVGETVFRKAVRQFVKKHAWGAADWSDLVAALERASGRDLKSWAEAWVKRRGMPDVRLGWKTDSRGRVRQAALEQQSVLGERQLWPLKLEVLASPAAGPARSIAVTLRGRRASVAAMNGLPQPEFTYANAGDFGYGLFLLDEKSLSAVLARPEIVEGGLLRALVFDSLWDSVREAELAPAAYIDFVIRVAPGERDPVTLASLLGRARVAFLQYSSGAQREESAARIEKLLADNMLQADTPGRRITFLRAFLDTAWSESARAKLKALLGNTLEIPGARLSSRDRFAAIARLLALGDPDAKLLLAMQAASDTGDDARRYAFAAGAAERSAEAKRGYFERFLNDPGLAENWTEAGLGPFNSVEQAELTAPYLDLALAALPMLKASRKIFFVNDWLAAFLGGQVDGSALEQVERYAREPDLDPDLRLKVLEAMDGLERTVRIRAKYAAR